MPPIPTNIPHDLPFAAPLLLSLLKEERAAEWKNPVVELQQAESSFLNACRLKTTRTPVWFMRQAGRYMPEYRKLREKYDLLTLCKTPELAAEITLQPVKALDVDAAILFADLLLPLEPMGMPFHFAKQEGPIIEKAVQTAQDVKNLRAVQVEGSLFYVLSTIRMAKRSLAGKIPLIGFAGAPFTLASYMIEGGPSQNFLRTKKMMYQEPGLWHDLMSRLAQVISDFLAAQISAGADAVQLFDSWVGTLSPRDYRRYALPYTKTVVQEVSLKGVPIIHFGTRTAGLLKEMKEAGAGIIGVDWRLNLDEAWNVLGPETGIQGNLDPAVLLAPLPVLKKEIAAILDTARGRPGHIFNLGHGILPQTPVDHVKAAVEAVKTYSGSSP